MRKILLSALLGLGAISVPLVVSADDAPMKHREQNDPAWKPIRDALGRDGKVDDGILRINFPRSDMKDVSIAGSKIEPGMVYTTWFSFMPMPDGSTMMMGDICMTQDEVAETQRVVLMAGMEVSGLHNHVLNESKPMMFMHIMGHGDPAKLTQDIKAALAKTATPVGKEEEEEKDAKQNWSGVQKVFGSEGEVEGKVIEFAFPRADQLKMHGMTIPSGEGFETSDEASFSMVSDTEAVAYAEFMLLPDEVTPTLRTFVEHGLTVAAVHNHMISEEPRTVFVHAWGRGDPVKLAEGVKAALEKSNVKKPIGKKD